MLSFYAGLLTAHHAHVRTVFTYQSERARGLLSSLCTEVNIIHGQVSEDRKTGIEHGKDKETAGSY